MANSFIYKGYQIIVQAGQHDDDSWTVYYRFGTMGKDEGVGTQKYYLLERFDSEKAAEVAAENAARERIDNLLIAP
jgi:hypothetical protein